MWLFCDVLFVTGLATLLRGTKCDANSHAIITIASTQGSTALDCNGSTRIVFTIFCAIVALVFIVSSHDLSILYMHT